jgi:hypothetical protein
MAYEFLLAVLLICVLLLVRHMPGFLPMAAASFVGCLAATTLVHYSLENNGKLV